MHKIPSTFFLIKFYGTQCAPFRLFILIRQFIIISSSMHELTFQLKNFDKIRIQKLQNKLFQMINSVVVSYLSIFWSIAFMIDVFDTTYIPKSKSPLLSQLASIPLTTTIVPTPAKAHWRFSIIFYEYEMDSIWNSNVNFVFVRLDEMHHLWNLMKEIWFSVQ